MGFSRQTIISKIHLIISVLIVIPVAILYGFNPSVLCNVHLQTVDELHVFKAIMGIYLGFSLLWILGLYQTKYLKPALLSHIVFMLGLGFGRLLSMLIDGMPSSIFVYGTLGELVLGVYGLWIIKTQTNI